MKTIIDKKSYDYLTAVRSSIIIDIGVQLTNDKMLAAKYIKKKKTKEICDLTWRV